MGDRLWGHRTPPVTGQAAHTIWRGVPTTPAELTEHRTQLRRIVLADTAPAPADDDLDRLLLAFEELGSNGIRHGSPPVEVSVTATPGGWVLLVTDGAADRPPTPAIGRDAADGGLGLYLIATLAAAHGWDVRNGRKYVWACIDRVP